MTASRLTCLRGPCGRCGKLPGEHRQNKPGACSEWLTREEAAEEFARIFDGEQHDSDMEAR